MKKICFFLICCLLSAAGYAQLLKGTWEGKFMDKDIEFPIFLEFTLSADSSTYEVLSYSKEFDGSKWRTAVCKVFYQYIQPDSVYLEEIEALPPASNLTSCFQKMYLKISIEKKKIVLSGEWKTHLFPCAGSGTITFWKKREDNH